MVSVVNDNFALVINVYVLEKHALCYVTKIKKCPQLLMKRTAWHIWLAYGFENQELTLGHNA